MQKEIIVKILADRVKAGGITLEQVPQTYRADVQALLEVKDDKEQTN